MDVTKPYKSIGFGAMTVTKPNNFLGFGAMGHTAPTGVLSPAAVLGGSQPQKTTSFWAHGHFHRTCRNSIAQSVPLGF